MGDVVVDIDPACRSWSEQFSWQTEGGDKEMETLFFDDIKKLIGSCGTGPLWVHSGLSRVTKAIRPTADRQEFLNRHLDTLTSAADGRNIWFPAFN